MLELMKDIQIGKVTLKEAKGFLTSKDYDKLLSLIAQFNDMKDIQQTLGASKKMTQQMMNRLKYISSMTDDITRTAVERYILHQWHALIEKNNVALTQELLKDKLLEQQLISQYLEFSKRIMPGVTQEQLDEMEMWLHRMPWLLVPQESSKQLIDTYDKLGKRLLGQYQEEIKVMRKISATQASIEKSTQLHHYLVMLDLINMLQGGFMNV